MKASTLSILVVLVLMLAVPMWFLGPGVFTGKYGSETSDSENLKKKTPKDIKAVVTDREVVVYKWHDKHGVMQFSSVPPTRANGENGAAKADEVERIVLSPNTNVMDAIKMPKEKEAEVQKPNITSLGSPYSPKGMKDMIDGSLQLQQQVNEQQTEQKKMIDEMLNQK